MKTATTAKEDLKESAQSDMQRLIKDMGSYRQAKVGTHLPNFV